MTVASTQQLIVVKQKQVVLSHLFPDMRDHYWHKKAEGKPYNSQEKSKKAQWARMLCLHPLAETGN